MVARDHTGDLLVATVSCKHGQITPELAEAIGIKEALRWVKNKIRQPVVVETDCLTVVQTIRCSSVNLSYLGRVVDECKSLVNELKNRHVMLNFIERFDEQVDSLLISLLIWT